MTPTILETMRSALEALEYYEHRRIEWEYTDEQAITNLRAAIKAMEDAEPVAWRVQVGDSNVCGYAESESDADFHIKQSGLKCKKEPLYPAPAVPEERNRDLDEFNEVGQAYDQGWNDCRKAMLAAAPEPPK